MARARVTDEAEHDLLSIWHYLAERGPASATRLTRSFYEQFARLAVHLRRGQPQPYSDAQQR